MILYFSTSDSLRGRNLIADHLHQFGFRNFDMTGGQAAFDGGSSDDAEHRLEEFSNLIRSFAAENNLTVTAIFRCPDPGLGLFISDEFVQAVKSRDLFQLPAGGVYTPSTSGFTHGTVAFPEPVYHFT